MTFTVWHSDCLTNSSQSHDLLNKYRSQYAPPGSVLLSWCTHLWLVSLFKICCKLRWLTNGASMLWPSLETQTFKYPAQISQSKRTAPHTIRLSKLVLWGLASVLAVAVLNVRYPCHTLMLLAGGPTVSESNHWEQAVDALFGTVGVNVVLRT